MKAQLCWYRQRFSPDRVTAIAFLKDFNCYDVEFIVDGLGRKIPGDEVWEYEFINGPNAYIDLDPTDSGT